MGEKLSVFIATFNEELNIGPCIDSIGDLADELFVMDNFSSDQTVAIARERNAVVEQRKFDDFATNRNAAIEKLQHNWVLIVDADERVTSSLREEIRRTLLNGPPQDAYAIGRDTYFEGKRVRCWSTGSVVRLFRKDKARYSPDKIVHEELVVRGTTGQLEARLEHFTFRSFAQYLPKLQMFAAMAAKEAYDKGQRASWIQIFLYPSSRFFKTLFIRMGILDGIPGLLIAWLSSYSAYLKFAKLWELQQKLERSGLPKKNE